MKKSLIFFVVLLVGANDYILAQSQTWKSYTLTCDTTIVRYLQNEDYIVYSRFGSDSARFTYHNYTAGTVMSATIPPYFIINDFQIADNKIYAGGTYDNSGDRHGFLACFVISKLFEGVSPVTMNMLIFNNTDMALLSMGCGPENYDYIIGVKRIALYDFRGMTRIAYIADNLIMQNDSTATFRSVGYGDVSLLSSGVWDIGHYYYNKDAVDKYTDICVTDNKIIITAQDTLSSDMRLQMFSKTASFAATSSIYSARYYFSDHIVHGKVMTTAMNGDMVAVAYHFQDSDPNSGLAIKVLDVSGSSPTLMHSLDIVEPAIGVGGWFMNDIKYSNSENKIMILNRTYDVFNGNDSYIFEVPMVSISTGTYTIKRNPYTKALHSMDIINGRFLASGVLEGTKLSTYCEFLSAGASCGKEWKGNGNPTSPTVSQGVRHHCTIIPSSAVQEPLVGIREDNFVPICTY